MAKSIVQCSPRALRPAREQSSNRKNADLMGSAHLRRRWRRLKRNRCPEVNRQNVLPTVGVTRGGAPCAAIIIGRTTVKGSKARPRHCVRSVGVTGPCTAASLGGAARSKQHRN